MNWALLYGAAGAVVMAVGVWAWATGWAYGELAAAVGGVLGAYLVLTGVVGGYLTSQQARAAKSTERAVELRERGRYQEALPFAEDAVKRRRAIAIGKRPSQDHLARTLGDLGDVLIKLGRDAEALSVVREAVDIWRKLGAEHRVDFVEALDRLVSLLDRMGRAEEALPAAEEVAAAWHQLAADDPGRRFDLGRALGNLIVAQEWVGRHEEASLTAERLVRLWRELAVEGYRVGLARALGHLAMARQKIGRHDEALASAEEAVGLWRELAVTAPAHRVELASSLGLLAEELENASRSGEAALVAREGIALVRELAAANPVERFKLAFPLDRLGARLRQLGDVEEAQRVTEEAVIFFQESVTVLRELAAADGSYRDDLARTLKSLDAALDLLGREQEARSTTTEATALMQELHAGSPAS